jgi:hypothetical protein
MLRPSIYSWFSAYRAASLETDFTLVPGRVREALQVIHDRASTDKFLNDLSCHHLLPRSPRSYAIVC